VSKRSTQILVGDNAFHGISHLSQQRSRERQKNDYPSNVENAARLVDLSLQNGANGFMFSVSETTLGIMKSLQIENKPDLYAIVPYAYEYVRLATKYGGVAGLAQKISKEIILSKNVFAVAPTALGVIRARPEAFLKTYLTYEISRIKAAAGKKANLKSVLLHEVITDMALGLDLKWLFTSYIQYFENSKTKAGFETRNFPYLVKKFEEWKIDLSNVTLCASFNKIGFQMNPSQKECEDSLKAASRADIVAMSILAAGYIKPLDAINYLQTLNNINAVVVGVSSPIQAEETFKLLKSALVT
jgi:hypothetical protein